MSVEISLFILSLIKIARNTKMFHFRPMLSRREKSENLMSCSIFQHRPPEWNLTFYYCFWKYKFISISYYFVFNLRTNPYRNQNCSIFLCGIVNVQDKIKVYKKSLAYTDHSNSFTIISSHTDLVIKELKRSCIMKRTLKRCRKNHT